MPSKAAKPRKPAKEYGYQCRSCHQVLSTKHKGYQDCGCDSLSIVVSPESAYMRVIGIGDRVQIVPAPPKK